MAVAKTVRKPADLESISIDAARDTLGDLVARADYGGTATIITRYGKEAAVLLGVKDYARLISAA